MKNRSEYTSCWRRLVYWEREDALIAIWHVFFDELNEQGLINWKQIFVDASFSPAKKNGATTWVRSSVERVQSGWWWQMAKEFHLHAGPCLVELLRSKLRPPSSPNSKISKPVQSWSSRTEPTTAMHFEQNYIRKALISAARIDLGGKGRRPKTDKSLGDTGTDIRRTNHRMDQ